MINGILVTSRINVEIIIVVVIKSRELLDLATSNICLGLLERPT